MQVVLIRSWNKKNRRGKKDRTTYILYSRRITKSMNVAPRSTAESELWLMRACVYLVSTRLGFWDPALWKSTVDCSKWWATTSRSGALHSRNGNTSRLCILAFLSHAVAAAAAAADQPASQGRRPTHNYQTLEGASDGHHAPIRPVSPPWAPPVSPYTGPHPSCITLRPRGGSYVRIHRWRRTRERKRRIRVPWYGPGRPTGPVGPRFLLDPRPCVPRSRRLQRGKCQLRCRHKRGGHAAHAVT